MSEQLLIVQPKLEIAKIPDGYVGPFFGLAPKRPHLRLAKQLGGRSPTPGPKALWYPFDVTGEDANFVVYVEPWYPSHWLDDLGDPKPSVREHKGIGWPSLPDPRDLVEVLTPEARASRNEVLTVMRASEWDWAKPTCAYRVAREKEAFVAQHLKAAMRLSVPGDKP
jgi:hypothetical protein